MLFRKILQGGVALAALLGPFATVAHARFEATVTTAPYGVAAPVMGLPLLVGLVMLLAGGGAYVLRRTRGGGVAKVAFVATLTALAGLAYAIIPSPNIPLQGADCRMRTVHPFDASFEYALLSDCPNPIQILDINLNCEGLDPPSQCTVGQVLTEGQFCFLPACVR